MSASSKKHKFYGGILTEVWADKLISFLGVLRSVLRVRMGWLRRNIFLKLVLS